MLPAALILPLCSLSYLLYTRSKRTRKGVHFRPSAHSQEDVSLASTFWRRVVALEIWRNRENERYRGPAVRELADHWEVSCPLQQSQSPNERRDCGITGGAPPFTGVRFVSYSLQGSPPCARPPRPPLSPNCTGLSACRSAGRRNDSTHFPAFLLRRCDCDTRGAHLQQTTTTTTTAAASAQTLLCSYRSFSLLFLVRLLSFSSSF